MTQPPRLDDRNAALAFIAGGVLVGAALVGAFEIHAARRLVSRAGAARAR